MKTVDLRVGRAVPIVGSATRIQELTSRVIPSPFKADDSLAERYRKEMERARENAAEHARHRTELIDEVLRQRLRIEYLEGVVAEVVVELTSGKKRSRIERALAIVARP